MSIYGVVRDQIIVVSTYHDYLRNMHNFIYPHCFLKVSLSCIHCLLFRQIEHLSIFLIWLH